MPGEWDQERELRSDRGEPDPPGQSPDRPVFRTAHEREDKLGCDNQSNRRRGLPARLDLFFVGRVTAHDVYRSTLSPGQNSRRRLEHSLAIPALIAEGFRHALAGFSHWRRKAGPSPY